jgi:peptidoglycan biosynthesis protein MviN/MurJ (putative lipid II flippase)
VLFVVLRAQIVRVILGTGAFGWDATMLTGAVLALLVVSLVAQGLVILLVRACYAAGKTLVPLTLNVGSSVATVALAFGLLALTREGVLDLASFEHLMRVPEVAGSEILVLALAYSLGSLFNMVLLFMYIERHIEAFVGQLAHTAWTSMTASFVAGCVTYGALNMAAGVVASDTTLGVLSQGLCAGVAGVLAWALILYVLKNDDFVAAREALHRRLSRVRVSGVRGSIEEQ